MASTPKPATVELRSQLLDHALALLEESGPEAISVRTLARLSARSTQAIYTTYPGMPALKTELATRGHVELANHLAAHPVTKNPVLDLFVTVNAYLAWTRAHPRLYQFMTTIDLNAAPRTDDHTRISHRPAEATMRAATGRVIDAGVVHCPDPTYLYLQIAAALHGSALIELELTTRGQPAASGQTGLELIANLIIALGSDKAATHSALRRAQRANEHQ